MELLSQVFIVWLTSNYNRKLRPTIEKNQLQLYFLRLLIHSGTEDGEPA